VQLLQLFEIPHLILFDPKVSRAQTFPQTPQLLICDQIALDLPKGLA
jgi:hypothetical protein